MHHYELHSGFDVTNHLRPGPGPFVFMDKKDTQSCDGGVCGEVVRVGVVCGKMVCVGGMCVSTYNTTYA